MKRGIIHKSALSVIGLIGHWILDGLFIVLSITVLICVIYAPSLPNISDSKQLELKTPIQIYTKDEKLIAEYGNERRIPIKYEDAPIELTHAIISSEDDSFFSHPGIDIKGIARAFLSNVSSGSKQGASTITMQVARNFFLSSEQTYDRKVREIFLAFQLENELEKTEILELYFNKIFLGYRSYGFAAAAKTYYNKSLNELTLAQIAMLAGLPKAPSTSNPIRNAKKAIIRRNYVLDRMLELDYITDIQHKEAIAEAVTAEKHVTKIDYSAPYIAEMVRQQLIDIYGDEIYGSGFKVYTTIDSTLQTASDRSLRNGLITYDRRKKHYRGPISNTSSAELLTNHEVLVQELSDIDNYGDFFTAAVTGISNNSINITIHNGEVADIQWSFFKWPGQNNNIAKYITIGDIIFVEKHNTSFRLAQIPTVSGSLISIDPKTGGIQALTGGFDYNHSKFNRATQAKRQAGSTIKPFIYSYAFEKGYSPITKISGAPLVIHDTSVPGGYWKPKNYTGKYYSETTLRQALKKSLNLVSVRLMKDTGISNNVDYLTRFHFNKKDIPQSLSLSLGSLSTTPLDLVSSYASFANSGYKIEPFIIEYILDQDNQVFMQQLPINQCEENCSPLLNNASNSKKSVISAGNAFITTSLLKDVTRSGTAAKAYQELKRKDIAGKTGTTNNFVDAWFVGYTPDVVTGVWVGFDQPKTLGRGESGTKTALPIWIDYMKSALIDIPENETPLPDNVRAQYVDKASNSTTVSGGSNRYIEYFLINPIKKKSSIQAIQKQVEDTTFDLF